MIMVTLLGGRVFSERALRLLQKKSDLLEHEHRRRINREVQTVN